MCPTVIAGKQHVCLISLHRLCVSIILNIPTHFHSLGFFFLTLFHQFSSGVISVISFGFKMWQSIWQPVGYFKEHQRDTTALHSMPSLFTLLIFAKHNHKWLLKTVIWGSYSPKGQDVNVCQTTRSISTAYPTLSNSSCHLMKTL